MIKNNKIKILQNIEVDETLLKYKKSNSEYDNESNITFSSVNGNVFTTTVRDGSTADIGLEYLEYLYENRRTLYLKFKIWLYKKLYSKNFQLKNEKIKKNISVLELKNFFDDMKNNISELDTTNITEIINKYDSVLSKAKQNKQIALCEKLEDYVGILKNELILTTSEFNKFLDEKDVVAFYNKATKHEKFKTNLCLTYIKNFIKIIPNEISELKTKADELKVFDNYVILHYDYDGSAVEDTKAEKEKKKDPILFGVIKGSNRLYYIGDWVDVYCDLTLDVLIKTIGVDEKKLNSDTIIEAVNKI